MITSTPNACGPIEGYTQFTVIGRNFNEHGFGNAKCVFNNTIFMNATVQDKNTMICDSPPLESTNGDMWYNISVSLDGTSISSSTGKFKYYKNPEIFSVSPSMGPMEGGTNSIITGRGFNQTNICSFQVRYDCRYLPYTLINDTAINVTSFPVKRPGSLVVSVSGNN